ncbi:MAG: hypothetical protein JSV33_15045 [bacterium]|nr:MAG: hypothetical protein JSV33_15045 [bacterium]
MSEKHELLAEHYQKTYELTYQLWSQRNKIFILLLVVIGVAAILTYRPADTYPLLVAWLAKLLGIEGEARIMALQRSFPFALLHGILLLIVFYLMVNLCHRALYVLRSYAYLGALEQEIRESLGIAEGSAGFTRESHFYWSNRPWLLSTAKWVYVVLLGVFLGVFLWGRISADWKEGNTHLVIVDILVSIPIAFYFFGYAWYTLSRDSSKAIAGKDE